MLLVTPTRHQRATKAAARVASGKYTATASLTMPRNPEGVIAQQSAPQFSSSHAFMRSRLLPRPCGGTAIRMRTGKRRSASPIISFELAAIWCSTSVPSGGGCHAAAVAVQRAGERSGPGQGAGRQVLAVARDLARGGQPQPVALRHDVP